MVRFSSKWNCDRWNLYMLKTSSLIYYLFSQLIENFFCITFSLSLSFVYNSDRKSKSFFLTCYLFISYFVFSWRIIQNWFNFFFIHVLWKPFYFHFITTCFFIFLLLKMSKWKLDDIARIWELKMKDRRKKYQFFLTKIYAIWNFKHKHVYTTNRG